MPYVGLNYANYSDDAYKAKSGSGAVVAHGGKTTKQTIASVGAKISGSMGADGSDFRPFVDISVGNNFAKSASVKSIDLGNIAPNTEYTNPNRMIVSGRLGVEVKLAGGLNATLTGGADMFGSKTKVYSGSLRLGYQF